MRDLAQMLGDDRILDLWLEFEAASTPEARLIRDLDVIEMALQARTYQRSGALSPAEAQPFIESAGARIATEIGRRVMHALAQ